MTSTPLRINKKSPFWINFSFKFKQNKKIFIMLIILQLISLPLFLTVSINSFDANSDVNLAVYGVIAVLCMAVSVLLGLSIATNTFNHLHKKSLVDMVYSLPISIKDRFFSNFLSGLTTYIVPYIGAMILSLIINALGLAINKEWNEVCSGYTDELVKLMVIGLFIMLFVYVLSVFITTCCGTLFESTAYIFIINILIPSSIATFFFTMASDLYGISIDKTVISAIKYTSPIGGLFFVGEVISDVDYGLFNVNNFLTWLGIYSLVIAGIFALTYFLYKKRKAEDVSKPFVYNLLYYIIVSLVTFNILVVVKNDDNIIIPFLIPSAVVYLIFEVVKNRGFKKIHMTAIRFGATAVSIFILTSIISSTNFFGIEYYIPSEKMVKSVTFEYIDENINGGYGIASSFTTDNPEVISALIKAHEDAVDDFKEDTGLRKIDYDYSNYYNKNNYFVGFTYNMKTGTKSSREYSLTFEQMIMLSEVYLDDNYIDKAVINLRHNMYGNQFNLQSKFMLQRKTYTVDGDKEYNEIADKLCEAYKKDLKAQTMEDVLTPEGVYGYLNSYPIRTTDTNTIALLEKYGYTPYSMSKEFKSSIALDKINSQIFKPIEGSKYISTGDYAIYNKNFDNGVNVDLESKEVMELLKVAQPIYTTTDACYTIELDGRIYVIPLEYSDLAEKVYKMYD